MTSADGPLHEAARRIWAAAAAAVAVDETLTVSDRLLMDLEKRLRRWIGAEGYASLLARSIAEVLPEHAAITTVSNLVNDESELAHRAAGEPVAQQQALLALLVAMMQQLGAIIGENLAVRLIEQSATPSPRGPAGDQNFDTSS